MNHICFIYRNMDIGGCELLICKFANEAIRSEKYSVTIVCALITDDIKESLDNRVNLIILGSEGWDDFRRIKDSLCAFDKETAYVTFLWKDFSVACLAINKQSHIIFYAVHFNAVVSFAKKHNNFTDNIRRILYKHIIEKLIKSKNIVAMDEQTIEHTRDFFGIDCKTYESFCIVRIPVDCVNTEVNDIESYKKYTDNEKTILAVARAEFPFKGYLIGLMDAVNDLEIPSNYKIQIVSYGQDYRQLLDKYESLHDSAKKRIQIFGKMKFEQLIELYSNAHFCVGMGTTLVDAALFGTISIPVVPYTYKLETDFFFYQHPEIVALDSGCDGKLSYLLNAIDDMDKNEIQNIISETKRTVKIMYSTEETFKNLISILESSSAFIDRRMLLVGKSYILKNNILKKLLKSRIQHNIQTKTDK